MNFKEFKTVVYAGKEKKIKEGSLMYGIQRKISAIISWSLVKMFPDILPNHVTVSNIIILIGVFLLVFIESKDNLYWVIFLQLILLNFTSILDKVDGEIARYKKYYTQKGVYYDLIFHFFYSIVFYVSIGYFFYFLSNNLIILLLSLFAGLIMLIEVASRKAKHHIKYKIELEKSREMIRDYIVLNNTQKRDSVVLRIINYFVFFTYDWVWILYLVLILISFGFSLLATDLFILHLIITITIALYRILVTYPRTALYTQEDFNS